VRAALLALFLGAARGGCAEEGQDAPDGRTIESVAYTSDAPVDQRELKRLIALEVGRPLTDGATAETIRNLFGTLHYSNVLVEAQPTAQGGVAVTVHLWRAFIIHRIRFEGKFSLTREELRRAIPFAEGDPFTPGPLAAGANAIARRLLNEGYLHPAVDPEVEYDRADFGIEIVYKIQAGERGVVEAPFFDGETSPFSAQTLTREGKIKVGKPYREAKARDSAERIRKYLLGQGYFKASVELIAAEPTEAGRIRPVYRIDIGTLFQIQASGIKLKHARREILALLAGQSFDEDLLELWAENHKLELQRAGHYRASVTASISPGGSATIVAVSVDPGPKYAIERISISGNASVDEKTLRALMETRKKGLPIVQKGRLIDPNLDGDISAILGYYQTHGWIDARVEKPAIREGSKPDRLDVGITIDEGPRTYVFDRRIEGAEHLSSEEIDKLVAVRVGEPLNPVVLRQDVGSLTTYYWNTGWREAAVQDGTSISQDRTKADVVYRVVEGERSFFGKTIIRGNAVTREARIERQVAWKEGEPFSQAKIADTQQNLARTGAFRSIEIRPQPVDPDNQERNVDIQLAEARRISLLYGFGYQNVTGATENRNDVFGIIGGTYRNLFGSMRTASLELQYAPISGRGHVFASFQEPYLFNTNVPLTLVIFAAREPIQDIDIDRLGGFLESVRLFGQHLRVGLRYEYQQIAPTNPEDLSTIEREKFPKSDLPIKQSAIGPSLLYDRRDDILDPHRGYYWTLAGKYAFPFLTADARYGKVSSQAAWFTPLLRGVLGVTARGGAIFPYGPPSETGVPIAERFFSGGSAHGRGFNTDLLGIPGVTVDYNTQATLHTSDSQPGSCASTFPDLAQYDCNTGPRIIGGNGFFAWSVEYRVPVLGNLGVSVFYDLAQVWENPGDINFRIEGASGLRQSIGAGFHYLTPIGPLRLEYGLPLDPRTISYEVTTTDKGGLCETPPCTLKTGLTTKEGGRIFLSIGYPF
jgi:outer membrane protein insertion porin family